MKTRVSLKYFVTDCRSMTLLKEYYRKWLNMPISGNISHLHLPTKSLGLNISAAKQVYNNCKLSVRRILKTSINPDARKLFNLTMNRNAKIHDVVLSAEKNLPTNKSKKYATPPRKRKNEIPSGRKYGIE